MRKLILILLFSAGAFAQTTTVSFEIAGMTCALCEDNAEKALRGINGVTTADVDLDTHKATVTATRELRHDEVRKALAKLGFDAGFANDPLLAPLSADERARLDIATISKGAAFDLDKHLAKGKVTIVDFWAEWCGPCHALSPKLEHLVRDRDGIALRTIELVSWESAAAKQATGQFKLPGLPYVRVYGPNGRFAGAVIGNDIEKINKLIEAAKR